MKKIALAALVIGSSLWSIAGLAADYVAVRIEAENFTSKDDRWYVISETQNPDVGEDPDGPHFSDASGKAHVELLPDNRVTHADEFDGTAVYWGSFGGPQLNYSVNFPEAGRYIMYAKAYSTGTEDNGVHVDLNGTRPGTGERLQWCNGKNQWTWSSAQRTALEHCGVPKNIFLDVPAAGIQTVSFHAREDGFELDQFIIMKETHDGSLDCTVLWNDKIQCKDVATGNVVSEDDIPVTNLEDGNSANFFPELDLELNLTSSSTNFRQWDEAQFTALATNISDEPTATNPVVTITLPAELAFSNSSDCAAVDSLVTCTLAEISAGAQQQATFSAIIQTTGSISLSGQVTADQPDPNADNNSSTTTITAAEAIPDIDGSVYILSTSNAAANGDVTSHAVIVSNNGLQPLQNAIVTLSSADATLNVPTDICTSGEQTSCQLASIAPGAAVSIPLTLIPNTAGHLKLTANLTINADEKTQNNAAETSITVVEGALVTSTGTELALEAEAFASSSPSSLTPATGYSQPAWYLVAEGTSLNGTQDSDNEPPTNASGSAYVEALPDARQSSDTAEIAGASNFALGGDGPTLSYPAIFDSAGRYFISARIRATNDQDATVHFGIDNTWPESASAVQSCVSDGTWKWARNRSGQCESGVRPYLDIDKAGLHTIMVSQAADGLELDKFVLSANEDSLVSGTGPEPAFYGNPEIDLEIIAATSTPEASLGEISVVTVWLRNLNATTAALDTQIEIDGLNTENTINIDSALCSEGLNGMTCVVPYVAPGEDQKFSFEVTSSDERDFQINATLAAATADTNTTNNNASTSLSFQEDSGGIGAVSPLSLAWMILLSGFAGYRAKHNARKKISYVR